MATCTSAILWGSGRRSLSGKKKDCRDNKTTPFDFVPWAMDVDSVLLVEFCASSGLAIVLLGLAAWGLSAERRAQKYHLEPRPGRRFGTNAAGAFGTLYAILTLMLAAWIAGR